MFSIVYVSTAAHLFSNDELVELLDECRSFNCRHNISGMLLYQGGTFMQVLEGEEDTVRALCDVIKGDPRHHGFLTLMETQLEERDFPDWSMGFCNLDQPDRTLPEGYSEFLNTPLSDDVFSSDPSRCRKLLRMFKKSMAHRF